MINDQAVLRAARKLPRTGIALHADPDQNIEHGSYGLVGVLTSILRGVLEEALKNPSTAKIQDGPIWDLGASLRQTHGFSRGSLNVDVVVAIRC